MKTHSNGNDVKANFIRAELQVAATYCYLAKESDGPRLLRYLENARRSYDNVIRYMLMANLQGKEFTEITADTERLKFMLEALEADRMARDADLSPK